MDRLNLVSFSLARRSIFKAHGEAGGCRVDVLGVFLLRYARAANRNRKSKYSSVHRSCDRSVLWKHLRVLQYRERRFFLLARSMAIFPLLHRFTPPYTAKL